MFVLGRTQLPMRTHMQTRIPHKGYTWPKFQQRSFRVNTLLGVTNLGQI
jgi:hypothetical protein